MTVQQLHNSKRNSHGSWVLCLLVIVRKVVMGLTLAMWTLEVEPSEYLFCMHIFKWTFNMLYISALFAIGLLNQVLHFLCSPCFLHPSLDLNLNDSITSSGYENGVIQASAFRSYHTPLNKQVWHASQKRIFHFLFFSVFLLFILFYFQVDYVNSMRAARDFSSRVSDTLKVIFLMLQQIQI